MKRILTGLAAIALLTTTQSYADEITGDPEAGKMAFRKCQACHMVGEKAVNRTGPSLNGILGRQAGTIEGFNYSPAMKAAGEEGMVWTATTIDEYLQNPREYIPRNKMVLANIRSADERANVIAYLATFSEEE